MGVMTQLLAVAVSGSGSGGSSSSVVVCDLLAYLSCLSSLYSSWVVGSVR